MSSHPIVLSGTFSASPRCGLGVSHLAVTRMEKAETREVALEYANLAFANAPISGVASLSARTA